MAELSVEEWRKVLEDVSESVYDGEAKTSIELSEELGMPLHKTKQLLKTGLKHGCVERCPIRRENMLGHMQRLVGFKLLRPKGENE